MGIADTLRAELFGATTKTPPFAMLLPQGWAQFPGDPESIRAQVRRTFAHAKEVDADRLSASVEALLAQAANMDASAHERMIASISQVDVPVEEFVPMSMGLAWIQAPAGTEITSMAKQLVANRRAAPLDAGGAILRWVDRSNLAVDGGLLHLVQPTYVIRVPHAKDTALIIRTTILDGGNGTHADPNDIEMMTLLSDGIVATFRWGRNV